MSLLLKIVHYPGLVLGGLGMVVGSYVGVDISQTLVTNFKHLQNKDDSDIVFRTGSVGVYTCLVPSLTLTGLVMGRAWPISGPIVAWSYYQSQKKVTSEE